MKMGTVESLAKNYGIHHSSSFTKWRNGWEVSLELSTVNGVWLTEKEHCTSWDRNTTGKSRQALHAPNKQVSSSPQSPCGGWPAVQRFLQMIR